MTPVTPEATPSNRAKPVRATIIPCCTEREFFEWIYPYGRYGNWNCIYCGEPIEYARDGTVYVGRQRLVCTVEDLGGFYQLCPNGAAAAAVNRCCSDRISAADQVVPLGRAITCPICGDTYTSAMVARWQGSTRVKGYLRTHTGDRTPAVERSAEGDDGNKGGVSERGYAVDHNLAVPALVSVERLSSRPR
jgi:hypothetical protein